MIFLTGKLLHLAHSLCAVGCSNDAPVTKDGKLVRLPNGRPTYAVQHAQTVQRLTKEMPRTSIQASAIPEYAQALALVESNPLTTGHGKELAAAAMEIKRLAEQFSKSNDGSKYAALDSVLDQIKPHDAASKKDVAKR